MTSRLFQPKVTAEQTTSMCSLTHVSTTDHSRCSIHRTRTIGSFKRLTKQSIRDQPFCCCLYQRSDKQSSWLDVIPVVLDTTMDGETIKFPQLLLRPRRLHNKHDKHHHPHWLHHSIGTFQILYPWMRYKTSQTPDPSTGNGPCFDIIHHPWLLPSTSPTPNPSIGNGPCFDTIHPW